MSEQNHYETTEEQVSSNDLLARVKAQTQTVLNTLDAAQTRTNVMNRALRRVEALPDADKRLLREVRATPPEQLATRAFPFRDPRYAELLFRYRARNWPDTLSGDERERWEAFRRQRLTHVTALTTLTLDDYFALLASLRADPARQDKLPLLDQLQAWGETLATDLD